MKIKMHPALLCSRRLLVLLVCAALTLGGLAALTACAQGWPQGDAPAVGAAPAATLPALTVYAPLVIKPAEGATYYVDNVSGSDANLGDAPERAWRTLAPVQSAALLPGDAVLLRRGGAWPAPLRLTASGDIGYPIEVGAYGSGRAPTIYGHGAETGCCVVIDGDWVHLEGLALTDAEYAGVQISEGAEHVVVRACEIVNAGIGVAVFGRNNLITGNNVHDLHMVTNTPGGDDDYGAVGVWLFASDNEVSYNTLRNCRAFSYDYGLDGGAVEFYGAVNDCAVHHNWAQDCEGFLEVGGGDPYGREARRNVVSTNVLIDNRRALLFNLGSYQYATDVEHFRFEHNTVVESRNWKAAVLFVKGELTGDELIIRNNIFAGFAWLAESVDFTHTYNLYQGLTSGHAWGEGEFAADPRFTNRSANNLTLQANSPAIDRALDLGYPLDYAGRIIPYGPAPDLGAYEYSGE